MANPLERIQEQRAMRLLHVLQSDLRAQIRQEHEHQPKRTSVSEKQRQRIVELSDPKTRDQIWSRVRLPSYQNEPIQSLPKSRDFWTTVNVLSFQKKQLEAACRLLDLPIHGRKKELLARLQDWIHEPAILAARAEQEQKAREAEAVLASGRVFAFGANANGELGLGHRTPCESPTEVVALRGKRIRQVATGFDANYAFAIGHDGAVYAWGGGGTALFSRSGSPFLFPTKVEVGVDHVQSIACARIDGHVALVSQKGECFTWGRGEYGELGTDPTACQHKPGLVTGLKAHRVTHVSVGNCHSGAVTDSGRLYMWGGCWSGQLGLGEARRAGIQDKRLQLCFPSPTLVETLQKHQIVRVSCGAVHSAALSSDGHLFTFGCGDGGRLGHGTNSGMFYAEMVTSLAKDFVLDVACGSWHSLCIARPRQEGGSTVDGYVYAFGNGLEGQLGLGKQKLATLPTRIPSLFQRKIRCRSVAVSSHHSCALTADGRLFTWGENANGCLGRCTGDGASDATQPELMDVITAWGAGPIVSVAAGHRFTIVVNGPWKKKHLPPSSHQEMEKLNAHTKFDAFD